MVRLELIELDKKSVEISGLFRNINEKSIAKFSNSLNFSEEREQTLDFVMFERNDNDSFRAMDVTLRCLNGGRKSYAIKLGFDNYSTIKASDINVYLSKMLIVDGNTPTSIDELKGLINDYGDIGIKKEIFQKNSFNGGLNLSINDLSEITIKINNTKPENKKEVLSSSKKLGL